GVEAAGRGCAVSGVVYTAEALAYLDSHGSLIGYDPSEPLPEPPEPPEPPAKPELGPDEDARRRCLRCRRIFGGLRAHSGSTCSAKRAYSVKITDYVSKQMLGSDSAGPKVATEYNPG